MSAEIQQVERRVSPKNDAIENICKALDKWYWAGKNGISRDVAIKPVRDVVEYVCEAKKKGLDKKSEVAYCGSILLYSVLSLTGRRVSSDVKEANELFKAGKDFASSIWDEIEVKGTDKRKCQEIADSISSRIFDVCRSN
jgi:hypothetical protein